MRRQCARRLLLSCQYTTTSFSTATCSQKWCYGTSTRVLRSAASTSTKSTAPPAQLFESTEVTGTLLTFSLERVLARESLKWAATTIQGFDTGHERNKPSFFDSSRSHCTLCDQPLAGSYKSHSRAVDHLVRMDLVQRELALLHTFYAQATTSPTASHGGNADDSSPRTPPRLRSSGSPSSDTAQQAASAVAAAAAGCSVYDTPYTRSPLFDEPGVPDHETLSHRPQALKQLDVVDVLLRRWCRHLHASSPQKGSLDFDRLFSLSSDDVNARLDRLRYLIFFLTSRGVLRDSTGAIARGEHASESGHASASGRTQEFERNEIIGDLVFKGIVRDRLSVVFPRDEGGVTETLQEMVRLLDSNFGLMAIYDYLNLDDMLSVTLTNNKTKSDVVEALAGELQAVLWSTQVSYNTDDYALPGERATAVYLRAVVQHTLSELGHALLMWRLHATLHNTKTLVMNSLEAEFFSHRRLGHGVTGATTGTSEVELARRAPRNAVQPLLLPWERHHGSARSGKEEAEWAMTRRPPRPPHTFPHELRDLSPRPCVRSDALERQRAVEGVWPDDPTALSRAMCRLTGSLVDDAKVTCSSVSLSKTGSRQAASLPDFTSVPQQRGTQRVPSDALAGLRRVNCVVLLDPLPAGVVG